jgi:hypothetical protein
MNGSNSQRHLLRAALFTVASLVAIGVTGCQVDVGGQTIPSPYYLSDDVQYFPPGPKFKCAREAAAMKAAAQEQEAQARR